MSEAKKRKIHTLEFKAKVGLEALGWAVRGMNPRSVLKAHSLKRARDRGVAKWQASASVPTEQGGASGA